MKNCWCDRVFYLTSGSWILYTHQLIHRAANWICCWHSSGRWFSKKPLQRYVNIYTIRAAAIGYAMCDFNKLTTFAQIVPENLWGYPIITEINENNPATAMNCGNICRAPARLYCASRTLNSRILLGGVHSVDFWQTGLLPPFTAFQSQSITNIYMYSIYILNIVDIVGIRTFVDLCAVFVCMASCEALE